MDYEESEHSGRVVRIASVAALGGLLFGYDSAVINGAVSAIEDDFRSATRDWLRGRVGAARRGRSARWSPAGWRTRSAALSVMKIAAVLFLISAFGTGLAPNVWLFGLFRVVGGIGVGVASVIAPAYIAETSPPRIRGRLGSLQQLAIVTGIFVSLAVDCAAGAPGRRVAARSCGWAWRPGAGCSSSWRCLRILYGGLAFTIPESPRYLVATYRIPEARRVLSMLLGEKNLEMTITRIQESLKPRSRRRGGSAQADRRALRNRLGRPRAVGVPAVRRHQRDLLLLQRAVAGGRIRREPVVHHHRDHVGHQHRHHADRDRADRQDRPQAAAADRLDRAWRSPWARWR